MTGNKLLLEELTWPEVERSLAAGFTTAVVAPTIRVGCSEHHMDFPGTLS